MQERSCHISSIDYLTAKQRIWLKSPLIDVDNKHNKFFPSFSFFNKEFEPGNRLIDLFSDYFLFHFHSSNLKKHIEKLDKIHYLTLHQQLLCQTLVSRIMLPLQYCTFIPTTNLSSKYCTKLSTSPQLKPNFLLYVVG